MKLCSSDNHGATLELIKVNNKAIMNGAVLVFLLFNFKGCVHYISASLFLSLKESFCETIENAFYFTSKARFVLGKIEDG